MLGAFLFFIVFAFLCLLIRVPRSQHATPWWVEIATEAPHCTYYFGPFNSVGEAQLNQRGYIEDLQQEGAKGMFDLNKVSPKFLRFVKRKFG